mmetsp:Transcript_21256/g.55398  ORF Transcript_21256/g.55398 Transcript_21256/m.55398 type:complete len:203 (-) Transcript_21256:432-1040(-)
MQPAHPLRPAQHPAGPASAPHTPAPCCLRMMAAPPTLASLDWCQPALDFHYDCHCHCCKPTAAPTTKPGRWHWPPFGCGGCASEPRPGHCQLSPLRGLLQRAPRLRHHSNRRRPWWLPPAGSRSSLIPLCWQYCSELCPDGAALASFHQQRPPLPQRTSRTPRMGAAPGMYVSAAHCAGGAPSQVFPHVDGRGSWNPACLHC